MTCGSGRSTRSFNRLLHQQPKRTGVRGRFCRWRAEIGRVFWGVVPVLGSEEMSRGRRSRPLLLQRRVCLSVYLPVAAIGRATFLAVSAKLGLLPIPLKGDLR